MIYQNNGISVSLADGTDFRLDPKTYSPDAINLVSHAHSDHLPSRCNGRSIVMSGVTQALLKLRKRATADRLDHHCVRSLDAGHVIGSHMFFLEGEYRLLYTGDFCTKKKFFSAGARPVNTDVLIIESTFGSQEYVFPDTEMVASQIRSYVASCFERGESVIVLAYAFGKAQELVHLLADYVPFVDDKIYEVNEALRDFGYAFCHQRYDTSKVNETREPFVLVTTGYPMLRGGTRGSLRRKTRTIAVSGWAINRGFHYFRDVDQAFALSDHADFQDLINFVDRCNPEIVYTCHGFANKFAKTIRKLLGIYAIPLAKGQHSLWSYV